ncbi:MAG: hypothetical protein APR62_03795 [Smithella sp. SDB]|nr:MAG: hypothetical protein APR62_03795 [Smithella sp. SDB]
MLKAKSILIFCFLFFITFGSISVNAKTLSFSSALQLNKSILDQSIELASKYILVSQKDEGNFVYEYNLLTHKESVYDSQVRQAGALWGLALTHKEYPSSQTFLAMEKGLRFFKTHSLVKGNVRFIVYPGEKSGSLGTVALVTLALIDFIPTVQDKKIKEIYKDDLDQYVNFLLLARKKDGQFYSSYNLETGQPFGNPSPYFDGEALLALVKAVKYSGYKQLKPIVLQSASRMHEVLVQQALKKDVDSPITKGFYQWGSMSFFEIYQARWENYRQFGQYVIDLAYWMIDVHETLKRPRNTAYAHEGLNCAWEIARLEKNEQAAQKIASVIDQGLYKLISWQKGSPLENEFLKSVSDTKALGAVMNSKYDPVLRIDVTQHQVHAMLLARKYLYSAVQDQSQTKSENKKVSSREIKEALLLAGEYLKNAVRDDGSFVYEYYPPTNKVSPYYNMLRHAGTIYAMVELYNLTNDKTLLKKIQKVITFLIGNLKSTKVKDQNVLVAIDYDNIKLGGNALAILALAEYIKVTETREYLETAQKLARWIQATQASDGSFLIHKQNFTTKKISGFISNYYPGEAIYALTSLYKIDKNKKWLDTAEKAAHYLILVRDGGKTPEQLNQDHWLLYGLNELYRLSPQKIYYEHALKITEAILNDQRKDPSDDDAGSFDKPAYSTASATRIEGLSASYQLVKDFGTKKELEAIFNGIYLGIQFLLKNQITEETVKQKKWPAKAVGGFQENSDIPNIRIDCVQHNVSALLGAYRMLEEKY